MSATMGDSGPMALDFDERRVIGVLIEKSLTVPASYPMTVNGIVVGANQKSGRDPVTEYVDEEVEAILERLQKRGLVTVIHAAGSRTERWRQELTKSLELDGQQMAVIAELLLRGPQTVGDLRARASRMKPLPDQDALQLVLDGLAGRAPPLVVRLTPQGVKRGVRVTHGLYPADELATVRAAEDAGAATDVPVRTAAVPHDLALEVESLRRRVELIERKLGLESPPLSET